MAETDDCIPDLEWIIKIEKEEFQIVKLDETFTLENQTFTSQGQTSSSEDRTRCKVDDDLRKKAGM